MKFSLFSFSTFHSGYGLLVSTSLEGLPQLNLRQSYPSSGLFEPSKSFWRQEWTVGGSAISLAYLLNASSNPHPQSWNNWLYLQMTPGGVKLPPFENFWLKATLIWSSFQGPSSSNISQNTISTSKKNYEILPEGTIRKCKPECGQVKLWANVQIQTLQKPQSELSVRAMCDCNLTSLTFRTSSANWTENHVTTRVLMKMNYDPVFKELTEP